jgi:hypothetical protein
LIILPTENFFHGRRKFSVQKFLNFSKLHSTNSNQLTMHTIIKDQNGVFAVKFTGKIEKIDYDEIVPILEERIKKYGEINLYWEMEKIEGWELKGILSDLKFDVKHPSDFKKIAIVGEKKWQELMTWVMKPFTKAKVRYFDISEKEEARNWIGEKAIA